MMLPALEIIFVKKVFGLFLLIGLLGCISVLYGQELHIYIDNQPFTGQSFKEYQQVFLELEEVKKCCPGLQFSQTDSTGSVSLNNIPFSSLKHKVIDGTAYSFISAREFAQVCAGRYEYNPQTGILDLYTFQVKPVKLENIRYFLKDSYSYPAIVQDVSKVMGQRLGLSADKIPVEINFVASSEIKDKGGAGVVGYTQVTLLNSRLLSCKVFVADDLSTQMKLYALAHELGHVWYAQYRPEQQAALDINNEGFAEWIAFKVMKALNYTDEELDSFHPGAPVYRQGRELYFQLENRYGYQLIIDSIKAGSNLP